MVRSSGADRPVAKLHPFRALRPSRDNAVRVAARRISVEPVWRAQRVLWGKLKEEKHLVKVPENVAVKARAALERMFQVN